MGVDWRCFSGTHSSTCGLKAHKMLTRGKRKELCPKEATLFGQRKARSEEMSLINRTLWAGRGAGGDSAVRGEHTEDTKSDS